MPGYRNVNISICTQFDLVPLQEFKPPPWVPPTPARTSSAANDSTTSSSTQAASSASSATATATKINDSSPSSSTRAASSASSAIATATKIDDSSPSSSTTSSASSSSTTKVTTRPVPRPPDSPDGTVTSAKMMSSPKIPDHEPCTPIVYVEHQPGAQFWVRWRVIKPPKQAKRPLPPKPGSFAAMLAACRTTDHVNEIVADAEKPANVADAAGVMADGTKYYYFKLFLDGREVVSWSAGAEDGWRGKVLLTMFEGKNEKTGGSGVEKRYLYFGNGVDGEVGDEERLIEVRVYRAKGRKRMPRDLEALKKTEAGMIDGQGVRLANMGLMKEEHPKRFYKFALLDPVDEPHAVFKFYYRTLGISPILVYQQLIELGLVESEPFYDESDSEISIPDAASNYMSDSDSFVSSPENSPAESSSVEEDADEDDADETQSQSTLDGYYTAESAASDNDSDDSDDTAIAAPSAASEPSPASRASSASPGLMNRTNAMFKRLSFPPSTRLQPSREGTRSASPKKLRPLPPVPTEDEEQSRHMQWLRRSPSPIKRSSKKDLDAPLPEPPLPELPLPELPEKRPGSAASLRRVFSRAMGLGRAKSPSPDKERRQSGGSSAEG
ncbi:hypothetical protein K490DRAFT_53209 [Saccharata proteae CBS 121410]|uniref:Uncharacterized protein n=1 Tax=Saccharata proteae CBS 121410 TaxID=1314787 RepID=A0A9P4I1W7_9PEZI|nr:hypothetical protein K490DRAFT_53209 [Saccharata proteae CBS 121410]